MYLTKTIEMPEANYWDMDVKTEMAELGWTCMSATFFQGRVTVELVYLNPMKSVNW